jgi:hypothetical protein
MKSLAILKIFQGAAFSAAGGSAFAEAHPGIEDPQSRRPGNNLPNSAFLW